MGKVQKVYKEIAEYWNMSIPLKKLDLVALPYYTGVKPADSWGLIIFK
jgi:aminopeptidase N